MSLFLQIAQPIFNKDVGVTPVGAIIVTLNFSVINDILHSISGVDGTLSAYLLDSNGIVISDSRLNSPLASVKEMDLNKIKLSIHYDPNLPFEDAYGESVNGVYFSLPSLNWTLLITAPEFNGLQGSDLISLLLGGAGAGTLTIAELLKKRKELSAIVDSVLSDSTFASSSSLSPGSP